MTYVEDVIIVELSLIDVTAISTEVVVVLSEDTSRVPMIMVDDEVVVVLSDDNSGVPMIMTDDKVVVVLSEDDSIDVKDSEILFEEIVFADICEDGLREVVNRVDEVITTVVNEEDNSDDNIEEVLSTVDDNFNNLVDDGVIYDEYALLTIEEDNSDNSDKEVVSTKTGEEEDIAKVPNTADVKVEVELIVDDGSNNSDNGDEVV